MISAVPNTNKCTPNIMILILFISFVVSTNILLSNKTIIQPYGPKLCELFCRKGNNCTSHVFDEVHLECKINLNTSSVDPLCNNSHQLDIKDCDFDNKTMNTDRHYVKIHSVMREEVEVTPKRKRPICIPARVKTFFKAIREGKLTKVKRLLSKGMVDVNCRGNEGQTAAMHAAWFSKTKIFDYLVLKKCILTSTVESNNTVLHIACMKGNQYIVQKLLDERNMDIDSRGENGKTPLILTASNDQKRLFKFLLNRGADINVMDNNNNTFLHATCESGNTRMLNFALSLKTTDIECRGSYGRTPLMIAVYIGWIDIVKRLKNRGASVDKIDNMNNNILHVASLAGHFNMVKYVLSLNKSEIDCRGYLGRTPLLQAAEKGHTSVVRLLRRRGADIKTVDSVNNTIMHMACMSGHINLLKFLLSLNTRDVDYRGKLGRTPLMVAVEHGHINVVRYLIRRKKAHLTSVDKNGLTVLHIACLAGDLDMVKYLVSLRMIRGFEKRSNKSGYTPIQMARKIGHTDIVSYLKSRD